MSGILTAIGLWTENNVNKPPAIPLARGNGRFPEADEIRVTQVIIKKPTEPKLNRN
ncbi:MAG: hypothetical protein H6970_10215 [Gammaproteobacteria bacterium]|nr:hypothetical protein [Gammaproteobacteria bacterium]MCP5425424.1 hypothetical protein [Gammaproteobacteria bacterium]MCP5459773.1 hypothetical protein [Gammaproteobacteria bacterium]